MIGSLRTHVRKEPIIAFYFESVSAIVTFSGDTHLGFECSILPWMAIMFSFIQPIVITGQPYRYENLLEDTTDSIILAAIETQDDNTDDTVNCIKNQVTSPQTANSINQDIFRIRETYSGSMSKIIYK